MKVSSCRLTSRSRESAATFHVFPRPTSRREGFRGRVRFPWWPKGAQTEPHSGSLRLFHAHAIYLYFILIEYWYSPVPSCTSPRRAPLNPRRATPVNHRDGPPIPQRNVNEDTPVCCRTGRVTCLLCSALLRLVNGRRKRFALRAHGRSVSTFPSATRICIRVSWFLL